MKRISEEEQRIILMHVAVNSANLRKAFADAALQLGRSEHVISNHYYSVLRPHWERLKVSRKDLQPFFKKIKDNAKYCPNVKNTYRKNPEEVKASLEKKLAYQMSLKRDSIKKVSEIARLNKALSSLRSKL